MEVQLGADATTTRGLVLRWCVMPLRGKVPRDSWCGIVRIKWGAPAAVRCRYGSGFNSDMLATAGVGLRGKVYQLTGMLPFP